MGKLFLGLGLGQTEAAVALLPLTALHKQVNTLVALEDIAANGNLAGAFQRGVEAHGNDPSVR